MEDINGQSIIDSLHVALKKAYCFEPKYDVPFYLRTLEGNELFDQLKETNDDDILSEVIARALDAGWSCFFYAKHKVDFPQVRWYVFDQTLELEFPDETTLASFSLDEIIADDHFLKTYFSWGMQEWYKKQLKDAKHVVMFLGSHLQ